MAKYAKKAGEKVARAIHEKNAGTLKTGSGKKVTSRKQAIAIGLSEAKAGGAKVPKKATNKLGVKKTAKKAPKKSMPKKKTAKKSKK